MASEHARKHEARPPRVKKKKKKRTKKRERKKELGLDLNDFGFICADVSNVGGYKRRRLIDFELSVTNSAPSEHQGKTVR